MKKLKVTEACICCGACQSICDDVFEIGDDGFAHVMVDEIPTELEKKAIDALENCPTGAIVEVED